jgi:hypothetical protein
MRLPVIVPTQVAPAQETETQGVTNVAVLDATTIKAGCVVDMCFASGAKAEVATVDEVTNI